ncbi:MAG: hypothetical protein A2W61_02195 [Deltaproteobacteria bacterium RIFCSPLOWO2_01_44_7]|nr:MAG: hypothetical protein A2712_05305 [Deltaproteobacteria bacterium RIFCSPHIGHO2_01_FULL_43_49]OGQ14380.1 MAG: hypothetical protein A3D22_05080 [Deltaproteobacteria bacterium RIFCSPHIGHO2_02_FULL_44_53]OGQ27580.1 MAG: hypothetical protein A3D98_09095 [Deltaproteobacteria bacterium RIFCSPHIGHO2_12_FULL_44_21]OGQ30821.1 MAG: hypothetical protein A2979_01490 [Deltaproteobacteria bacterium RIFCSPLOWO2_01_FULL_45_74]OGQ37487.1 MAG: hypothetical protein A2W61_02195 [Deltaproteobacteria bacterium 
MRFDQAVEQLRPLPWFDIALLTQVFGQKREVVLVQLHQWVKQGKIIPLKRGMYTLSEFYRKALLSHLKIANEIYKPSYLSLLWVLYFYDVIPERVVTFTSVTTRPTRTFQNAFGTFSYSTVKKELFWGFSQRKMDETLVWIAEPEKALFDFFYLSKGLWTQARMEEMRFQNLEIFNKKKLKNFVKKWGSKNLNLTMDLFLKLGD